MHVQFLCGLHISKLVYDVVPDVEYGQNVEYRGVERAIPGLDSA